MNTMSITRNIYVSIIKISTSYIFDIAHLVGIINEYIDQ